MLRRAGLFRSWVHVLLAVSGLGLAALAPVLADSDDNEPRVVLAGGQIVRPGEIVELRWTSAMAITELEILLSLDGGRTYTTVISPSLDPSRGRFSWQVPPSLGTSARLRIRYNRGGREIEGPPTRPLELSGRHPAGPTPLGLPPEPAGDPGTRTGRAAPSTCIQTMPRLHATRPPARILARVHHAPDRREVPRLRMAEPVQFIPLRT